MISDIPQERLLSGIVSTLSGSNLFVGQVGIGAEFLDTQSNEVLAANVVKEAGKKYIPFTDREFDPTSTRGQVEQQVDNTKIRHAERGDTKCTESISFLWP